MLLVCSVMYVVNMFSDVLYVVSMFSAVMIRDVCWYVQSVQYFQNITSLNILTTSLSILTSLNIGNTCITEHRNNTHMLFLCSVMHVVNMFSDVTFSDVCCYNVQR